MTRWFARRFPTVPRQLGAILVASALLVMGTVGVSLALLIRLGGANHELETSLIPLQLEVSSLDRLYRNLEFDARSGQVDDDQLASTTQSADEVTSAAGEFVLDHPALSEALAAVDLAAARWIDAVDIGDTEAADEAFDSLREQLTRLEGDVAAQIDGQQHLVSTTTGQLRFVLIVAGVATAAFGILASRLIRNSISRPIEALVAQLGVVANGDLSRPIVPSGPTDLAAAGAAAETMRLRLLDDARRRAESALIAGHLAESDRLAGQLHDDQVQAMTLASIRLQRLRRKLSADDELTALAEAAEQATNDAITRLRGMIFELHSPVLESEGIASAIEVYLDETFGDSVEWTVSGDDGADVPLPTARLLYRLGREAMFNAFKHARATKVDVSMKRRPGSIELTVTDDGVGFDTTIEASEERGHLGLAHSIELTHAAGGTWECTSAVGRGTEVRISLPTTVR